MNKTTYTTTRFDVSDDFYVEVSEEKNTTNFVLCHENFGIKTFMFGLSTKHCPSETWEELIINNVNDYIPLFKKYEH